MTKQLLSLLSGFVFLISAPTTLFAAPSLVAPTNLNVAAVSSTQIDLSWQDNSGNETGFKVERGTDGINFSEIASVSINGTTYSDTGLSTATTYYYRVRAFKVYGNNKIQYSGYSNTDSATTLSNLPAAPSNLAATLGVSTGTSTPVMLTWTDNADNETGFTIQRSADGITFGNLGITSANYTTFENLVANGATYYYRVKAFNFSGSSAYSNVVSVSVP